MGQCRSTTSVEIFDFTFGDRFSLGLAGVQCKFSRYHHGDHFGPHPKGDTEVSWPNTETEATDDWDEILGGLRDLTERDYAA